ncbi:MAG: type II toxin-antitoxin system RelE/ParE family toxin [Nitrospirota bacterium]
MKLFVLTRKALDDLRNIALYTEDQWGVAQRNIYLKQFDDTFHTLGKNPALGKACDDVMPGYRKFPEGSHVIFYKPGTTAAIEVVRILHKSMDVQTQFHGA